MIAKSLIRRRSVLIAVAVIALMTLTAGVAAAHSAKEKFSANGVVGFVGLAPGGTVESKFRVTDEGAIKSIKVRTIGEAVGGMITGVTCKKDKRHGDGTCPLTTDLLTYGGVLSIHESSAKLKVTSPAYEIVLDEALPPAEVVNGTLKGKLKAELGIESADKTRLLTGTAKLNIKSTPGTESTYGCLLTLAVNPYDPEGDLLPIFGSLATCIAFPGPNPLTISPSPMPEDLIVSPVMVPLVLFVTDKGEFTVSDDDAKLKGKLKVVVASGPAGTTGTIEITKGVGKYAIDDHDHDGEHGKKGKDKDDD
jgi:hypothetical protein